MFKDPKGKNEIAYMYVVCLCVCLRACVRVCVLNVWYAVLRLYRCH